jgi:hypothetical protein
MTRLRIAHWIWNLTIGGDAKNLVALAVAQSTWADVSVLIRSLSPEQNYQELEEAGIEVSSAIDLPKKLIEWVELNSPELVIFHRNGRPDSLETRLVESLVARKIACFQYNTFARVDPSTASLWSGQLHLSCTSMMQYAQRLQVSPLKLPNHAAIGYPVAIPALVEKEERALARQALGVPPQAFVALRLVRPDLRKWDPMPVLAVRRMADARRPIHLIVRAAPSSRAQWIKEQCRSAVSLLEPTSNPQQLRLTLAASDCLVNCSQIGETFGLGLAEAMAAGLPPIVNSTPHMDNAQIELCQHGVTGLVANTVSGLADALRYLQEFPDDAQRLGLQARRYIQSTFATEIVELRLRHFLLNQLEKEQSQLVKMIPPIADSPDSYKLDEEWLSHYSQLLTSVQPDKSSLMKKLIDETQLSMLRLSDNISYALSIGIGGSVRAIKRRLRQGSLARK